MRERTLSIISSWRVRFFSFFSTVIFWVEKVNVYTTQSRVYFFWSLREDHGDWRWHATVSLPIYKKNFRSAVTSDRYICIPSVQARTRVKLNFLDALAKFWELQVNWRRAFSILMLRLNWFWNLYWQPYLLICNSLIPNRNWSPH